MVILDSVTKFQLEKQANQILGEFGCGFQNNTSVDITALAVFHGFAVKETDAIFSCADAILRSDKRHKFIHINRINTLEIKRLAIAFLLASYFLKPSEKLFITLKNQYHRTANSTNHWFNKPDASKQAYLSMCLLAPKENFINQYDILRKHGIDSSSSIIFLKDEFKIPKEIAVFLCQNWTKS